MSRNLLRTVTVAALLCLSFSSLGQAAEHRTREWTPRLDLLRMAAEFLVKRGCGIDPNGICAALPIKHGCGLDPNGACLPPASSSTTDRGCSIDPNGVLVCIDR